MFIEVAMKPDPMFKELRVNNKDSLDYISNTNHVPTDEETLKNFFITSQNKSFMWNPCGIMKIETIMKPQRFTEQMSGWSNVHTTYIKVFQDKIADQSNLDCSLGAQLTNGNRDALKKATTKH